jgi:hypothetical protein
MKVYAKWEFDVNIEGIDKQWVDVEEYAKELTELEMKYLLEHNEINANEFSYEVEENREYIEKTSDEGTVCNNCPVDKILHKESKPKQKTYYASGKSFIDGRWQTCGWSIEANSFEEAARIAEADENFRLHSLYD